MELQFLFSATPILTKVIIELFAQCSLCNVSMKTPVSAYAFLDKKTRGRRKPPMVSFFKSLDRAPGHFQLKAEGHQNEYGGHSR